MRPVKFADLLVVCGFAFDPLAGEVAATLGRLAILQSHTNPDLAIGDELLKKTGSGNLFMVFGEPDIELKPPDDGRLTLELEGLDLYDPATCVARSSSVDDIPAWPLDTDYDGDAFFGCYAYITGAAAPQSSVGPASCSAISDDAWATISSTMSLLLPRPNSASVADKVIGQCGVEAMKAVGA